MRNISDINLALLIEEGPSGNCGGTRDDGAGVRCRGPYNMVTVAPAVKSSEDQRTRKAIEAVCKLDGYVMIGIDRAHGLLRMLQ